MSFTGRQHPACPAIGSRDDGHQIYRLTVRPGVRVFSAANKKPPMNIPKTILLGLLFAGAFLAFGFVAGNRHGVIPAPVRFDQTAAFDPAVMSQVARAQAAVALSQAAGAANLLPLGL
jgi:hypothetical protein